MLVAATSLLPLGYVVVSSAQLGPGEAVDFLVRPRVGELLWNTTRLLVGGVLLSVVLGVGCAWLVVRTDLPAGHLWHGVLAAPLAVPAFVNGYGWVSTTHAVQGYLGAVLVVSLSYYPLVYLPTVAALRRLDSGLEDVAAALGHRAPATFARVVLPAISPAVLGGALLVGLHLLGEYGALQILNYPTLTTGILAQYRTTFNGPAATLLALVLVVFCMLLLGLELLARGRAAPGAGGRGRQPYRHAHPARNLPHRGRRQPGRAELAVAGRPARQPGPVAGPRYVDHVPGGRHLGRDAHHDRPGRRRWRGRHARGPPGGLARRTPSRLPGNLLERSVYPANALPGIVVALALVTVSIRSFPAIYQTVPLLVIGYSILFLPRAVVSVRATLELAPPVLDDVARSLGSTSAAVARRVVLPLVLPGLGASLALVSLAVSTELTATLLLAPTGTSTLATEFWARASAVEYGAAAPYAVLLIALSIPATWLLSRAANRDGLRSPAPLALAAAP